MRNPLLALTSFLLFLIIAPSAADDIRPRSPEVHEFMSPMVLDYSLDQFFKTRAGINTLDLGRFQCRGVTIQRFNLGIERSENGTGSALKVVVVLSNNSGKDKKASITFDLRTESSSLGSGTFRRLNVEQGERGLKVLSFPVDLPTVIAEPYPFLRITVELFDY